MLVFLTLFGLCQYWGRCCLVCFHGRSSGRLLFDSRAKFESEESDGDLGGGSSSEAQHAVADANAEVGASD